MISLCILHQGNMLNLYRTINSALSIVSEIIIVDSGGHDYTNICKTYRNVKVLYYKGEYSFASAKNMAVQASSREWVLFVDTDEILLPSQEKRIMELTENENNHAFAINILNLYPDGSWGTFPVTRLFRKQNDIRYEKQIHETINYALAKKGIIPKIENIYIMHFGYLQSEEKLRSKQAQYMYEMKHVLEQKPQDAATMWHLSTAYFALGKEKDGLEILDKAMNLEPLNKIPYIFKCRYYLSKHLYKEAIQITNQALQIENANYWNPTILLLQGNANMGMKDYIQAYNIYKEAIKIESWNLSIKTNLATCSAELNKKEEALVLCEEIAAVCTDICNPIVFSSQKSIFSFQEDTCALLGEKYKYSLSALYSKIEKGFI